jgi:superfamily I DNA/RNA helicase
VLVDEGQDLNPSHWQFLRVLVAPGPNDLFIAQDSHQRIYGQRIVLSRYGIKITGRSRRLTFNYRTTAQNLGYAVGALSGADYVDLEDRSEQAQHYRSARSGPTPRFVATTTISDGVLACAEILKEWLAGE